MNNTKNSHFRFSFGFKESEFAQPMPYAFSEQGFFYFSPEKNLEKQRLSGKAFMHPKEAWIVAFGSFGAFIKRTQAQPLESIHSSQALAEIFHLLEADKKSGFLELEFHSPVSLLKADAFWEHKEYWKLACEGESFLLEDRARHLELLPALLKEFVFSKNSE